MRALHHQVCPFQKHLSQTGPSQEQHGSGLTMHACAGQLPALEHGIDIVEGAGDADAAAEAIITYLKQHGHDLDAGLSATQVGCLDPPYMPA